MKDSAKTEATEMTVDELIVKVLLGEISEEDALRLCPSLEISHF